MSEDTDKGLKLFVWHDVLADWTYGIMFSFAKDVEQARKMIELAKEYWENTQEIYEKEPEIVDEPKGFLLRGGG